MVEKDQVRRCCTQCWRLVFIILNVLFFVIGLALIAFGIYLLATDNALRVLTGNEYASGGAVILVAGVITAIISFVGILGAAGMWSIVLGFYIGLMVLIVILEITAAVLGFVFRNQLVGFVTGRVTDAITQYSPDDPGSDVNAIVDFVQNTFDCCGFTTSDEWLGTDFFNATQMYPESCNCSVETEGNETCLLQLEFDQFIWMRSCNESISDLLANESALVAIGVVGVVFGLVELFGLGVAIGLCCCFIINKREDDDWGKPI